MSRRFIAAIAAVTALAAVPVAVTSVTGSAAATPGTQRISIHRVGSGSLPAGAAAAGELRQPAGDEIASSVKAVANRSPRSHAKVTRTVVGPSGVTPTQVLSVSGGTAGFEGINHYSQRFGADGGNQWSLVPPDQALCANSTQVVEAVNNAIQVYDTAGTSLSGPTSINQLYWNDHEINRTTGVASPHQMGDPSCVFDADTNRFIMTVYDLTSDAAGNPTGSSSVDIAISPAGTAIGTWSIYTLNTSSDGTDGNPARPSCPCFGDYPHLGTDANGLYITTNEYSTLGNGYNGANVYAISKSALVAGTATIPGAMFGTKAADLYKGVYYDGFTLAPAVSTGTSYAPNTMYFLSSDSWSGDIAIVSTQILVWKIANTSALATDPGSLRLDHTTVPVAAYFPPPASDQKVGSIPLADCLNLTACAKATLGTPDKYKESEFAFDSSDTRMLQSAYANGLLWGALDTAVDIGDTTKAGVAYYVVNPTGNTLVKQGTLAVTGNNISYPALGVTSSGKAVMALSLVGKDYYPSSAYVSLDAVPANPASAVNIVGAGAGPADDFSGYRGYQYNRPRWGDYGAAAVVGSKVWIASEYIAQTCTLSQFTATNFTCGNTRTLLANWSTHVTGVDTSIG